MNRPHYLFIALFFTMLLASPVTAAVCGDSNPEFPEECDDGDFDTSDSCPDAGGPAGACLTAVCGDSYIWNTDGGTETCDDGDSQLNDDCPDGALGTCQSAVCGDGFVWSTDGGIETCDDGDSDNSDSCPDGIGGICAAAFCGDGFVWSTDGGIETCDDGDSDNSDSCPDGAGGTCAAAVCGDNLVWSSDGGTEECDGSSDAACPGLCETPASANPCMCNFPPIAFISADVTSGVATLTVTFTAVCNDLEGSMDTCVIDFGDGDSHKFAFSAGGVIVHNYTSGGSFSAIVTALDTTGLSGTVSETIDVREPQCVISSVSSNRFYKGNSTIVNIAYNDFLIDPTLVAISCGGPPEGALACNAGFETCTISCGPYPAAGSFTIDGLVLDDSGTSIVCTNDEDLEVMDDPICSIDAVDPSTPITPGLSVSIDIGFDNFIIDPLLTSISCGSTAVPSGLLCDPFTETCVLSCGVYNLEGSFDLENLVLDNLGSPIFCSGSESVVVSSAPACTIDSASPNVFSTGDSTTLNVSYTNFDVVPTFVGVDCGDIAVLPVGGPCAGGTCVFDCGPYLVANTFTVSDLILDNGSNVVCLGSVAVTATDSAFCSVSLDDPTIPVGNSTDLTVNFGNFSLDPLLDHVSCGGSADMPLFTSCDFAPGGTCTGTCATYDSEGLFGVNLSLKDDLDTINCGTDFLSVFEPSGTYEFQIFSFNVSPSSVILSDAAVIPVVIDSDGVTVVGPLRSGSKDIAALPVTFDELDGLSFDIDNSWSTGNYIVYSRVFNLPEDKLLVSASRVITVGQEKKTGIPETSLFLIPMLLAVVLLVLKKR